MSRCSATVYGPRVQYWQCTRSGFVEREGKWFCRQHDPLAKQAKGEREAIARARWQREQDAIYAEAHDLATALGVDGVADYNSLGPYSSHGYVRRLVISFDDARKLIERLR